MPQSILLPNGMAAFVDDADHARLSGYRWRPMETPSGAVYAVRSSKRRTLLLHREIMDPDGVVGRGLLVDHRDGDTLNCVRGNLRWVSASASNLNRGVFRSSRTGFKGVRADGQGGFMACLRVAGRAYHARGHATAEDAALAYNDMARRLHGEHARLNVVPGAEG